MIRHRQGDDFLLITQDDHARLSGRFAEQIGNAAFATPLRLTLGLAKPGTSEAEDLLRFNFALLRLMDALSLDACCAEPLFPKVDGVHPRPGAEPVSVRFDHPGEGQLDIVPWPFGPD